ncbi:hypothetical protein chiPu_0017058 [Chiloscyllium punctatum]|uniref:Uncharacterized protein n=1 Tax=Chiloscyllium punctatum TaxID=137246 RepID=A0A401T798_CHIPU|nr:hypothetical protein [Chiloscyllium punctatum]
MLNAQEKRNQNQEGMEVEEGEIATIAEGPSDSTQDFQKVQGEMEAELNSTKSGQAVIGHASVEATVTLKSTPSHKTAVMDLQKKEEYHKKNREFSITRKPPASITSSKKAIKSSDGAKTQNAEHSWQHRRGQTGWAQEENKRFGENCRSKTIDTTDKEKAFIFSGKRISSGEDWDAEYDTEETKSGGIKETSFIPQHVKNKKTVTDDVWETDCLEKGHSKQEGPLQLQETEEDIIDVGREDFDAGKKCHPLLGSVTCVQSNTSSDVENIFKIMEKDVACDTRVNVTEQEVNTVELHATS